MIDFLNAVIYNRIQNRMCSAAVFYNQYSEHKIAKKYSLSYDRLYLAGETRFEHATYGFGDRYSTIEPLP